MRGAVSSVGTRPELVWQTRGVWRVSRSHFGREAWGDAATIEKGLNLITRRFGKTPGEKAAARAAELIVDPGKADEVISGLRAYYKQLAVTKRQLTTISGYSFVKEATEEERLAALTTEHLVELRNWLVGRHEERMQVRSRNDAQFDIIAAMSEMNLELAPIEAELESR